MTLVSIKKELDKAIQGSYGIPLFDVFDMSSVDGVFEALEGKRAPTILGIYTSFFAAPNAEAFAAYIQTRSQHNSVPVSLMLDHGDSIEQCIKALDCGFTDVMYDGSTLPLEENIANTKQVVRAARLRGAAVEAELGHVGMGHQYDVYGAKRLGFTDPEAVEYFINETGVDMLAVAFGNAHGLYKGEPQLDLDLVREIRRRVDVPLVMHGGTGLTDDQYREVIAAGISKINIATVIVNTATERMIKVANEEKASMFSISEAVKEAFLEWCLHFYEVFGTKGKAEPEK